MRRNYFIKKKFQASFSARFALLVLVEALLIGALFFLVARGTITTGYRGAEFHVEHTASFFYISFALIILIAGIAMSMVGMAVFIFYSHRIAGPLFRFQKTLHEIALGDLTGRIRLRRKDQLGDLSDSMNRLTEELDRKIGSVKNELKTASGEQNPVRSHEALARAQQTLDSFKTSA